jgi:hypothetical protein
MSATITQTKIEIPYPDVPDPTLQLRVGPCRMHFAPSDGPMWIAGTYDDPTGALPIEVRARKHPLRTIDVSRRSARSR